MPLSQQNNTTALRGNAVGCCYDFNNSDIVVNKHDITLNILRLHDCMIFINNMLIL